MDIRLHPDDQAAASRVGADRSLSAVLRVLEGLSPYPWRACWVRVYAGLALFHFRRAQDPAGTFHRVPVGLPTLSALQPEAVATLVNVLLRRASDPRVVSVHLPAEALAVKTPLGLATYTQVAA